MYSLTLVGLMQCISSRIQKSSKKGNIHMTFHYQSALAICVRGSSKKIPFMENKSLVNGGDPFPSLCNFH